MALSQEELDLDAERLELVTAIEALKVNARIVKKQRDAITAKRQLEHKFGGMSDAEKASLRALLEM